MSKVATNQALLKALGIDQPLITAIQINMQPEKLPVVTIDRLIDSDAMLHEVSHFDLVLREEAEPAPAPAPAFDLDAMCTAARERLTTAVNHSAEWAMAEWREESAAIHVRMNKALRLHRKEAAEIMMRQEFLQAIRELVCDLTKPLIQLAQSGLMGAGAIGGLSSALADIPDGADAFHFGHGIGLGGYLNGKCRGGI